RANDGGPYNACRQLSRILRHVPPSVPGRAKARPGCQLLLVGGSLGLAAGFEQETGAVFGFVDEIFQKAGGRHVLVLVGDLMRRAHVLDLRLIVVHELQQHIDRGNVVLVVVLDPLQLRDMPDRADCGAADLACPLGQNIDAGCELIALLIEQQAVVAEMRAADIPMEVLRLHVARKRVRDQGIQRGRYFAQALGRQVSRGIEPSGSSAGFKLSHLGGHGATSCSEGMSRNGEGRPEVPPNLDSRQMAACGYRDSHKRYYGTSDPWLNVTRQMPDRPQKSAQLRA